MIEFSGSADADEFILDQNAAMIRPRRSGRLKTSGVAPASALDRSGCSVPRDRYGLGRSAYRHGRDALR